MLALGVGWVKELRHSSPEILREFCKMRLDMEKKKKITYKTVSLDITAWIWKKRKKEKEKSPVER